MFPFARKISPEEEELRERLSVRGEYPDDYVDSEGRRVPLPPQWRKPTTVVGTSLAKELEKIYKIAPETRGRASIVTPGYTDRMINTIANSKNGVNLLSDVGGLNIAGMTGFKDRDIYADNTTSQAETFDTLAHEMQHVMDLKGKSFPESLDDDKAIFTGLRAKRLVYPEETLRDQILQQKIADLLMKRSGKK